MIHFLPAMHHTLLYNTALALGPLALRLATTTRKSGEFISASGSGRVERASAALQNQCRHGNQSLKASPPPEGPFTGARGGGGGEHFVLHITFLPLRRPWLSIRGPGRAGGLGSMGGPTPHLMKS